eukprot:scaffold12325_cov157-Skeletonema_marinoi.AAC.1
MSSDDIQQSTRTITTCARWLNVNVGNVPFIHILCFCRQKEKNTAHRVRQAPARHKVPSTSEPFWLGQ